MESSKKHFNFQSPIDIKKKVYERKNTDENKGLVNVIENGLVDLANEIEEMSENEIENEKLYEIVHMKAAYKLEFLFPEIMKLSVSTKKCVGKDKGSKNVAKLEPLEVALVHFNLGNNNYQQASKVLFTFVPNAQWTSFNSNVN